MNSTKKKKIALSPHSNTVLTMSLDLCSNRVYIFFVFYSRTEFSSSVLIKLMKTYQTDFFFITKGRIFRRVHTPEAWRGFSTWHCHVNWTFRNWMSLSIVSNGLLFEKPPTVWIRVCKRPPGSTSQLPLSLQHSAGNTISPIKVKGGGVIEEGWGGGCVLWTWVVKQQHCEGRRILGARWPLFDVADCLAGVWLLLKKTDVQLKIYSPGQPCELDTLED